MTRRTASFGSALLLAAVLLLAGGAQSADTFSVTIVSQNNSTITLGWTPQPGYGYLFSANGALVSRTNDPARDNVRFAKNTANSYDIDVIVKGANGHCCTVTPPPPPKNQCEDGADNDGDGKIDLADPGCSSATDNDETDPVGPSPTCNLQATTANFAAQITSATAGQTVCLASGNYGTWTGTNKAITVRAASGATPLMKVNFGSGDSGFTLDGMAGMGGSINGVTNVTVKNSSFTSTLDIDGPNVNLVLDGNKHNWNTSGTTGPNAKIGLGGGNRTLASPAVIIRNTEIRNGDLDGIFVGGGSGYLIQNNTISNLCDANVNHTDNIQFADVSPAVTQTRVVGNFVQSPPGNSCYSQGITSFDHGTNGVIIENNVVDVSRPAGIELYSDVNSIVRHNTVVYRPVSQCFFNEQCGQIDVTRKSADPAGTGTQVYDNITTSVSFSSGSTGTAHHNVSGQTAVYVGPPTVHNGFLLAASSPVGRNAASDGTDIGVFATG